MASILKVDTIQDQDGNNIINESANTITIGASGDTITIASGATLTGDLNADNLTSGTVPSARITGAYTGITNLTMSGDLTVDTDTLFVDSTNNKVGIGTAFPNNYNLSANNLVVGSTTSGLNGITIVTSTSGAGSLHFADGAIGNQSYQGRIFYDHSSNSMGFNVNNGSERMRITSSGNVGIGTTAPDAKFQSGAIITGSGATVGNQAGFFVGAKSKFAGATGLYQNQVCILDTANSGNEGSGGALTFAGYQDLDSPTFFASIEGVKDNSTSGNYAGSLRFYTRANNVANMTEGMRIHPGGIVSAPSGIALGVGTANTASNVLDDYEEGTWTPTYVSASGAFTSVTYASTSGYYVKIGRIVNFSFYIQTNGITVGTASGGVYIQGLPFAPSSPATSKGGGVVINKAYFAGDAPSYATASGTNGLVLFYSTGSTANDIQLNVTDLGTGGTDNVFQMFGSYYVE